MKMIPMGRTAVKVTHDVHQEFFKVGDICYIDGYVQGGDHRPYAVLVRVRDGAIGHAPVCQLQALFED